MKLKKAIKINILRVYDSYKRYMMKKNEIKKFKDPRRKKIYSKTILSTIQKNEIDNKYVYFYGEKIPYTWHKHFTSFTGKFDIDYFPELLYIPEFEYYMNLNKNYCSVIGDKNFLPLICNSIGQKTPNTLLSYTFGIFRNKDSKIINIVEAAECVKNNICFIKPSIDSNSGNGCGIYDFSDKNNIEVQQLLNSIINKIGDNFIVQEKVTCHESLRKIHPNSVNTFRLITYIWKNKLYYCPSILRIGRNGNFLDNAHANGIFIAIDDDGTLHDTAFTEFNDSFTQHPDTKIKFKGLKIPYFPKVLESALKMHSLIPQIGIINWDYTINERGEPILIEANVNGGSIWLCQMAHGKSPFGKNTNEILQWLQIMKKTDITQYHKYSYGRNIDYFE